MRQAVGCSLRSAVPSSLLLFVLCHATALPARADSAATPTTTPGAGLFLAQPSNGGPETLHRLRGAMAQLRPKGIVKSMLTGGLSKPSNIATIDGARAEIRSTASPAFYFNLNSGSGGGPTDLMQMVNGDMLPPSARSASEFVLVRLDSRDGRRETEIRQHRGVFEVDKKDMIDCSSERVGDWAYRVSPRTTLSPGEYAFYFGAHGFGGQFWDFGVDAP